MRYGFQDYLSADFPSQIIIENTELCNYACHHCPHKQFEKSSKYNRLNLSLDLHRKLIDEIARDGSGHCRFIRYAALGETLLHPNFTEMIEYAGKNSGVPINITTNGSLLTENISKHLLCAGVNIFDISIDAYSSRVYNKIRKKGNFNKVRTNCIKLINLIRKGDFNAKVVISFVDQPFNHFERLSFKKYWEKAGADFIVFRPRHSASGSIKSVSDQIKKSIPRRTPCLYPWERLVINPRGLLSYCPSEWNYRGCFADFRKTSIKRIWQGNFLKRLRHAHLKNDFSKFPFCRQCPDWSLTVWPKQGKNYAEMIQEISKS